MNFLFNKAFNDYITEFHEKRDYFECHEIMEDAWKEKEHYTKQDPEVALIMLATGLYHLRRHNVKGAIILLNKTIDMMQLNKTFLSHYLEIDNVIQSIQELIIKQTYQSINLPLVSRITFKHPQSISEEILHKHKLRDRTDVILSRQWALNNKYPVQNTPDKTHHANEAE
ncbi:DUF309 domain-containing protein [Macrococcoides caseolyticum]|uniref:DUF309 domain-containing protein n=1 Tax=Macrococcoides caseolyticum TaxID=69966 RepID=UPI001F25B942|nr:DUF309 domain-containing protein [Macrococcus caseolyticus]MCE4957097.1 DUF309 domain-containing protein [Macrococcus caseolyticus]